MTITSIGSAGLIFCLPISFGGGLSYRFFERWSVSALANYTRLIDDAEDSPVVDDVGNENQFFAGALVNYRF